MLAVIVGRRRQGKSTLALALAKAKRQTILIFDPNNQFGAIPAIDDIETWLESADEKSIGRIIPNPPVEDAWAELADILDGGKWEWAEYTLILDEASMLMSPHQLDDRLERFARTSPKDVHLILTTHRARDINPLFRALATDWFVFQTNIALDIETLRKNFGDEMAQIVPTLPKYHVAHYWLSDGGEPKIDVWNKPLEWYIDIGRTT